MPGTTIAPGLVTTPGPATIPPPGPGPIGSTPRPLPAVSVLDLKVTTAENQPVVGSNVTFDVVLTNRGPGPATGVVVRDTYGAGLEHQERSPMTRPVGELAAGSSTHFGITFRVTRSGQLCHRVEATAADGAKAAADSCITAVLPASGAGPALGALPPGAAVVTPPPAVPAALPLEVRVSAPATSTVGKSVVFSAQIVNRGDQPITNVTVSQQADAALAFVQATPAATPLGNQRVWTIPSIPPGNPIEIRVQCDCKQSASRACCRFTAAPAAGRAVEGEACVEIAAAAPLSSRRQACRPQRRDG